jgi:hypothetical protein
VHHHRRKRDREDRRKQCDDAETPCQNIHVHCLAPDTQLYRDKGFAMGRLNEC